VLADVIEPLTTRIARLGRVSGGVLWGNVASAVNSAALQLTSQRATLAEAA
jgi:hypothetical protein